MSEDSRGLAVSPGHYKVGPDYFGYYKREVVELVSQDEDFLPLASKTSEISGGTSEKVARDGKMGHSKKVTGSLFCNGIRDGLSDLKRERLKALLRQSVNVLAPEVEEMLEPVVSMCRLQSQIKSRRCLQRPTLVASEGDPGQSPYKKKAKISSSSPSNNLPALRGPTGHGLNVFQKNGFCDDTETAKCITSPEEPKVDDDLQFLLDSDSIEVKEIMEKHSNELSATLGHMEQQLEELLDIVVSKCRPMTLAEKQQLRRLIQGLPPKNLERVVEIIQRSKPENKEPCDEIHVDLEKESNATLWRLYYYVEAFERTRKV
ncbi:uncharacterized protein LOC107415232 [Ziziphus jujuba]|nr:uncharacterized protein LOC107415232 [Ziziphus jujuba]XP_015879012.1 uncharacterized protein LOC107415232 [Ziziphus jujuba]XP_015879013.1 uncharacterized protein LOC107415232 [Ziziphus jujuba]